MKYVLTGLFITGCVILAYTFGEIARDIKYSKDTDNQVKELQTRVHQLENDLEQCK